MGKAPRMRIRRKKADFAVLQEHRGEEKHRWVGAELGEAAASRFPPPGVPVPILPRWPCRPHRIGTDPGVLAVSITGSYFRPKCIRLQEKKKKEAAAGHTS